jgi:hypothetical protein
VLPAARSKFCILLIDSLFFDVLSLPNPYKEHFFISNSPKNYHKYLRINKPIPIKLENVGPFHYHHIGDDKTWQRITVTNY